MDPVHQGSALFVILTGWQQKNWMTNSKSWLILFSVFKDWVYSLLHYETYKLEGPAETL